VVIPTTELPPQSSSTTFSTSTIPATSSSSTTGSATSTPTTSPSTPYTDLTAQGFRFVGCAPEERWAGDGAFRTLSGASQSTDTNTNEGCAAFCTAQGFKYAGTEWSRECWCGGSVAATRWPATTLASLEKCNYKCTGDQGQYCGGDAWLSLYERCEAGDACENVVFT
jgi:hypothetical protein